MPHRIQISLALPLLLAALAPSPARAQFSDPFPPVGSEQGEGRELPEIVPLYEFEPRVVPLDSSADRLAWLFNRDLRGLEEQQNEILLQLEELPEVTREIQRFEGFGYHSGASKQRPKWLQVDLGESVSPDAIALFPVTAEVNGKTIYGYGFPRNFRIDISDEQEFRNYETLVEGRTTEVIGARRWPYFKEVDGFTGRYVRVTATGLWRNEDQRQGAFALAELLVLKGDRNIAVGKRVTSLDTTERSNRWSRRFVCDGITTLGNPLGAEESPALGFRARSEEPVGSSWVQVDLGESMPVSEVRVILAELPMTIPDPTVRFPYPMTLDISEHPDMRGAERVGRFTPAEIASIGSNPLTLPVGNGHGRYVRLTVHAGKEPRPIEFELAELQVFSGYENVSEGKQVTALHPQKRKDWDLPYLVDGFSSRRNLVSYSEWLGDLDLRNRLVRDWLEKEDQRHVLVDETITRGVILSGSGLAAVFAFVLFALTRSRVRRRKDLEGLRQRIASDLHDDIGSNLSSIALLAELGGTEADEPELAAEEFSEIKKTADKTIESMRDIVWLIRPGEENWEQMLTRFRETAAKLLRAHDYRVNVTGTAHGDRLPLEFKRDLFLIYKEALNNIVRHAKASRVRIDIDVRRNRLALSIADDGIGFNNLDKEFREGNGLRNLRMRAQAIGAHLKVRSAPEEGTTVTLNVPMP